MKPFMTQFALYVKTVAKEAVCDTVHFMCQERCARSRLWHSSLYMPRGLRTKTELTEPGTQEREGGRGERGRGGEGRGAGGGERNGGGGGGGRGEGEEKYRHQTGGIHVSRQSAQRDITIYTTLLQAKRESAITLDSQYGGGGGGGMGGLHVCIRGRAVPELPALRETQTGARVLKPQS